jgi:hypothetical protein
MPEFQLAQSQNSPVYILPFLYLFGLNVSVAANKILAIAPGQARDSNDQIDMAVGFPTLQGVTNPPLLFENFMQPLYVNAAVNGVNGLDQGSLIASTDYSIYLIGDSRGIMPVAGIITLNSNPGPLMPFGYDSQRLLGFNTTNASEGPSLAFQPGFAINISLYQGFYNSPAVSVLTNGSATSFTALDLFSGIPQALSQVIAFLQVTFTPASLVDVVMLRPTGSSATSNLVTITANQVGVPQTQYIQVICGFNVSSHSSIDYAVTNSLDTVSISVVGYYAGTG